MKFPEGVTLQGSIQHTKYNNINTKKLDMKSSKLFMKFFFKFSLILIKIDALTKYKIHVGLQKNEFPRNAIALHS